MISTGIRELDSNEDLLNAVEDLAESIKQVVRQKPPVYKMSVPVEKPNVNVTVQTAKGWTVTITERDAEGKIKTLNLLPQ